MAGEGFSRVGVTCASPFNMGNTYWPHTFTSRNINMGWWILQRWRTWGKKYCFLIDLWMKTPGVRIAEIAAKMLASRWSRSNCSTAQHIKTHHSTAYDLFCACTLTVLAPDFTWLCLPLTALAFDWTWLALDVHLELTALSLNSSCT